MTKKNVMISLIMVFILFISGCKKEKIEGQDGKKVTVAYVGSARTLDPQNTIDKRSIEVIVQIFNSLVEIDEETNIVPSIAKKWEQINPVTTRFTIRDDVRFHDGSLLTIDDVIFSLNRMIQSNIVAVMAEPIDRVEKIDENTVDVITKYPYAPILLHLGDYSASIVSKKAVLERGQEFGNNPIGTGAFKLSNWENRDILKLVRHEEYFRGKPEIFQLVFRAIPEATSRVFALETGEVDIAYTITPIDVETVNKNKNLEILTKSPGAIEFIGFNVGKGALTNKDLRFAIIYALNPEEILQNVLGTFGTNINSPIAPGAVGYSKERPIHAMDLEKARKYFEKSGFKDGLTMTMTYHSNDVSARIAQIMQAQLREIGINLQVNPLEWSAFINSTTKGEHEIFHLGKTSPTNDASEALSIFQSNLIGPGGNRFFYSNPKLDDILEMAKRESNEEKRSELYRKAVEIIQNDGIMAFSFTRKVIVGKNKSIENFKVNPTGVNRFENVIKK